MNKIKITFIVLLFTTTFFAQEIKDYTWDLAPKYQIPAEHTSQPAVVLLDKRWVHTRIGNYAYATFVMNHFAVKISKAEVINDYNKIKAEDNGTVRKVRDFHARIIKPNGEIKVLPEDKIVEREVDKVKSIVFEGVEAGDILEYYFILKEYPTAAGIEVFQKEVPVLDAQFIHTGSGVVFDVYASDNFTVEKDDSKYIYSAKNIPAYKEEKYALNFKNIVKLIYNVRVGSLKNTDRWKLIMPMAFRSPTFNYFSKSKAKDFIENLKLDNLTTDEQMIKIDSYIKQNFDFVERGEQAQKITDLNDGKQKLQASDIFDLYGYTLKRLDIPYYVVVGVDRFTAEIDLDQNIKGIPHETMYYIPETEKFISPYEKYLAYGYPMYELQSTKGVAYNPVDNDFVDNFNFPVIDANQTTISTISNVSLNKEGTNLVVDKEYNSTGYYGQIDRQNIKHYTEIKEDKLKNDYTKERLITESDVKISDVKYDNTAWDNNYTNKPFKISAKINFNEETVEEASNLLIINLGKVIGKQSNLYQEKTRNNDIDLYMTKTYKHTINFTIPEGYQVENYKDLVINKKIEHPQEIGQFVSSVKQNGNVLVIEILETYNKIHYQKVDYDQFRDVINASSDFYKGSIILKKK